VERKMSFKEEVVKGLKITRSSWLLAKGLCKDYSKVTIFDL